MQKQSFDLHELLQYVLLEAHAAWRFRWYALAVTWAVAIVGGLLVFSLPSQYEATAQVYADTEALTNPLLRGVAVQPDVQARLAVITHTLLARPNLETVADKTGLSLRATTPAEKDELLKRLGSNIKIRGSGADSNAANLYNLSYADTDRSTAQKVVQAFLQILMNDTLGANTASLDTAQNFLQQQVHDYNTRLNDEEKKLAAFEKANAGALSQGGNNSFAVQLQKAQADLLILQSRYDAAASGHASFAAADPQIKQVDDQIKAYQALLDKLLLSYTNQYPDVVSAKRTIKQLQARRAELEKHPGGDATTHAAGSNYGGGKAVLARQIALQKRQIADLQAKVDKAADTQVTLMQLTRNYQTTKKQYDDLVSRLNTAQLSQDATQSGNNLKFRIINPPFVPLVPSSPKRGMLLAVVFLFALGAGGCFAYFLHKIKPVFLSLKSLREFGQYPVIGTFSMIVSGSHRDRRRRELVGFCVSIGLLALVVVVGFAFDGTIARIVQHVFVMGAT